MSLQGIQAKFRRLHAENAAWKLIRAHSAPYILAYIEDLFAQDNERRYASARLLLQQHLEAGRDQGGWKTENTDASTYLTRWIHQGWLREMDDMVSKTEASEIALRFCNGLAERTATTTASHLRIVQDALASLMVAVSPDIKERLRLLLAQKAAIEAEIDAITSGTATELEDDEKRERIREVYQLASVLTGDFRRVEDDIRLLNKNLYIKMIETEAGRADVLKSLLDSEKHLYQSDAGRAFDGFWLLVCDENRMTEFREQLRSILTLPVAEFLTAKERRYLDRLCEELAKESDRIFRIRQRNEEDLKSYIESGAAAENKVVDQLIAKLERMAIGFAEAGVKLTTATSLEFTTGPVKLSSPEKIRLRHPAERIDPSDLEAKALSKTPSSRILDSLEAIPIHLLAKTIHALLITHGPLTVAQLVGHAPITYGLEQLVAYIRIAKAINAPELDGEERVLVNDKASTTLQATIPKLQLSAELFPEDIEDMTI